MTLGQQTSTRGPTVTYQPPQQHTPYYSPPGQPGQPAAPVPPAPPVKKARTTVVLLSVLGVLGLVVIAGLVGSQLGGKDEPAASVPAAAAPTTEVAAAPVTTTAEPVAPAPEDFTATPKIVEKECFGSAGCNVTLRVDLEMKTIPDPAQSWLLVYEIRGVEDGPEVGNLTLTGDNIQGTEENVSISSSKAKITIKVTSVEKA